ncbi:hypothetical protein AB0G64_04750 [Streptomyces longwoodensis]|uniref:hypothetical protein n=1 Tax=Streptomyces longwoodensis TaxID=68231 RepID=UPI00340A8F47
MADWAFYAVVRADGTHEFYDPRFGAVGLDLDLLAGPDVVLRALRARPRQADHWRTDATCEAAALIDVRRRLLLLCATEGPSTQMRHRGAHWKRLQRAWPGWEVRWTFDGLADLRIHLGLDPDTVREADARVHPELPLEPGDEELTERDPYVRLVTVGGRRCHLLTAVNDHPVTEGPGVIERLTTAYDHGTCALPVDSGLHIDPVTRRVGWWLLGFRPRGAEMGDRWPGWTVEFWEDRWGEHVRAAPRSFRPPLVSPDLAERELTEAAVEHWKGRTGSPVTGWVQALLPADAVDDVVRRLLLES